MSNDVIKQSEVSIMSTAIKKVFQPILSLLEANPTARIKDILGQVKELASAKSAGGGSPTSFHKDEAGNVVGIRCYYHQKWMHPVVGDFGKKAGTASGFNSMCKDGLSKWTKQQKEFKNAQQALLAQVASGEVAASDINAKMAKFEAAKTAIVPREDGYGFDTIEELLADNAAKGV